MPERDLSNQFEKGVVNSLVENVGEPVEGRAYKIRLESGEEHVIVISENSVVSSAPVIEAFDKVLEGVSVFKQPDTLDIRNTHISHFGLSTRVENKLIRNKHHTLGQVIDLLTTPEGKQTLRKMGRFGEKSIEELQEKLAPYLPKESDKDNK